jgi:hypothetical protein
LISKDKSETESRLDESKINFETKLPVGQGWENMQKGVPSPASINTATIKNQKQKEHRKGPITTSTPQSIDYITVKGIESATSKYEPEWPEWSLKEVMDNAYDWLNSHYPYPTWESSSRKVTARIKIDPIPSRQDIVILRIAVRNSNVRNIPVFENIDGIFDFTKWVSEKRNQYMVTCGGLGDFLKRVLGMGYASWINLNESDSIKEENIQWSEPVTLRYNGQERKAFIIVDMDTVQYWSEVTQPTDYEAPDFTEQKIALPIPAWRCERNLEKPHLRGSISDELEEYYKDYKLAKSGVSFNFSKEELK